MDGVLGHAHMQGTLKHVGRKTGSAWAKGEVVQGGGSEWEGVTRQHGEESK